MSNDIIAVWHDESHLNKYMIDKTPVIMTPAYGYPQDWSLPFEEKIRILDKKKSGGHEYLRGLSETTRKKNTWKRLREFINTKYRHIK